ncbi:MAG: hypothetical protein K8S27_08520 [Candidatus Omnitrophica bacterium]|nr:hypothetical protein [Candidatus Omnitrophota bacterium]
MVTIQRMIMAQKNAQEEKLLILSARFNERIEALNAIAPPSRMTTYHSKLIDFHRAAKQTVDARLEHETLSPATGMRQCYEALLDFYLEMKTVMVKHECQQVDIDAIDRMMIRKVRQLLQDEY